MLTRIEKCKIALKKGYTYNSENGKIFGIKVNEITRKCQGYIYISISYNGFEFSLYGHQFAWFCVYNEIVDEIDHINRIRSDNRISNLRSITHHQNCLNKGFNFGVSFDKSRLKWISYVKIKGKAKNLGRFDCFGKAIKKRKLAEKTFYKIEL
jgi:hypothetical protein